MKKTIKNFKLKNKRVIIRCDFNVPMKDGKITDDTRIKESIPTILFALRKKAKVILMSHLGKVKTEEDKENNSLRVVADALSELLGYEVKFCPVTHGDYFEEMVDELKPREVMLVENTRFEDLNGKRESMNDEALAKYWASHADIFINDAYGSSHRNHASVVGIPTYIPSGIGFLVENEIKCLEHIIRKPSHPFIVVLGGAKVSDKIGVIENLVEKADKIIIGGGMAFTFLKAKGYEIGKSIVDEASIDFCQSMLKNYSDKIVLPDDIVVGLNFDASTTIRVANADGIRMNEMGMDIGPMTIKKFSSYIREAGSVVMNGPMGIFEFDRFNTGTKAILECMANSYADVLIGGGDTAAAAMKFGYKDRFYHISTGGGATLMYLEGKKLPGLAAIEDR